MINYLYMIYMLFMSMVVVLLFMYFMINKVVMFLELELYKIMTLKMEILIYLDWISLLFVSVVLMISSMVILYSIEYMMSDKYINRFIMLIIMFVLSMILMILSPNMISILVGWDGLGLISYSLVIYYQNENSYKSGMVTVLMNRIGDILILMLICLMIYYGSWNFILYFNLMNPLILLVIFAAFTKSAQIPFSSWLPMAMAAPTPVSSLVHSSTLVTAGVYLLIRFSYLIEDDKILLIMMLISLLTMFMSGISANLEFDLKKIIALSTLSQLGVMIFCLSIKLPEYAFFHLVTHAMFKSMLFMCAGGIIHCMMNWQDIRKIGMVFKNLPVISILFNCSSMSLCGMPFLSGFFSKDLILEMYLSSYMNKILFFFLMVSMGLTIGYSSRLIYYSFIKFSNLNLNYKYNEVSNLMIKSMLVLFLMSIMMGSGLSWMLFSMKNKIFMEMKMKLMIYIYLSIGMLIAIFNSKIMIKNSMLKKYINYYDLFLNMWFLPSLSIILSFKFYTNKNFIYNEISWGESSYIDLLKYLIINMFKYEMFMKSIYCLMIFIIYIILMVYLFN